MYRKIYIAILFSIRTDVVQNSKMHSVFKATLTVIIVFSVRYGNGKYVGGARAEGHVTTVRFCTTGEPQCTNGFMDLDTLRELGQVTGGTLRN